MESFLIISSSAVHLDPPVSWEFSILIANVDCSSQHNGLVKIKLLNCTYILV